MKQNSPTLSDIDMSPLLEKDTDNRDDVIDVTLIRWMLSLTPTERLKTLQQHIQSIMRFRNAGTDS